jgi:Zn-dependent M16 (insulinase) family peptidase
LRGSVDSEQELTANFVLSSKALLNKAGAQNQLMRDTLETVHFSETSRIADLISQQRARREQSITGSGHALAMTAACAGMSPLARLNHEVSGMAGIKSLRELDESLRDETALAAFAARLENLHQRVSSVPIQLLTVAEAEKIPSLVPETLNNWQDYNATSSEDKFHLAPLREASGEIWLANTQVNFCARAYPTVPVQHPDAAALTILGGVLRNGFLHRVIREQGGAYGGGASQDSGIAAFKFYSYRDPRLSETLDDFDASIDWMLSTKHEYRALEEAILGVVGSLDKPGSPAGEAKQHFHNRLAGQKHEQRQLFRQRILEVTLDDLQRVTQTYLKTEHASTAVITGSGDKAAAQAVSETLSLPIHEL